MRLYDGESVEGYNFVDVEDMKKEYNDEGMSGIDLWYVINWIFLMIIRKNMELINFFDVFCFLKEGFDQYFLILSEDREWYLNFIFVVCKEYDDIVKKEV